MGRAVSALFCSCSHCNHSGLLCDLKPTNHLTSLASPPPREVNLLGP